MNARNKQAAAYITLGSIYSFALALQLMTGTVLTFTATELFFTCLFCTLALAVMLYNSDTTLVLLVLGLLALMVAVPAAREYSPDGDGVLHALITRGSNIYWYIRGYLPYDEAYRAPIVTGCCVAASLVAAVGMYVVFSLPLLALAGFAVFIAGWALGVPQSDTAFLIFLACFVSLLAARMHSLGTVRRAFAPVFMPMAVVLVLAVSRIPTPAADAAELSALLREPVNTFADRVYLWFNPAYFMFQSTGFAGKSGRLGGKVTLNDRMVMRVRADERVYLAGAYYDSYTGVNWSNTGAPAELSTEHFDDYYETVSRLYDMRRHSDSNALLVLNPMRRGDSLRRQLTIDIGRSRTATLFQPPKAYELAFEGTQLAVLADENAAIQTDGVMLRDTSYTVSYISLASMDAEYIETLLAASGRGGPVNPHLPGFTYYYTRDEAELARYMALPLSLPERVSALAKELTREVFNDYDRARAIEQYLVRMPYTLSPADTPRERDFVDYFLFDGKEGYCTYYASAMAVLGRAVGIPSRYVEGYVLPPAPAEDGYYYVTNKNAHAWAELYIAGFGWVLFEATAPYYYASGAQAESPVFAQSMVDDPYFAVHMDELGLDEDRRVGRVGAAAAMPSTTADAQPVRTTVYSAVAIALVSAGACYYACVLLCRVYRGYDRRRVARLPNASKAEIYYSRLMRMCYYRFAYIRRQQGDTPAMYAERVGRRFVFRNESLCLRDIVRVIYRLRYSGRPMSDSEAELVRDGYYEMWQQLCEIRAVPVLLAVFGRMY